jgi:hypothetical protein
MSQFISRWLFSTNNKDIVTLFTYGHTGAGKTYTMFGNREKNPGILPLTLESIFAYIYHVSPIHG